MRVNAVVRRGLLAASALAGLCINSGTTMAASPASTVGDLGATPSATMLSVTLWLRSPREAAFEREAATRTDPASPRFHQWMSDAAVAGYAVSPAEIDAVVASLRDQGLSVTSRGPGLAALRVQGAAGALDRAFATVIHDGDTATGRVRFMAVPPSLASGQSELFGGVTGLSGPAPLRDAITQRRTAGARSATAPAATDPLSGFTDACFQAAQTERLSQTNSDGSVTTAVAKGPIYVAQGSTTTARTCGYTANEILAHYGLGGAAKAGLTGKGETVAIIIPFGSPDLPAEIAEFSQLMGLPGIGAGQVTTVFPDGPPIPGQSDLVAYADLTALEAEWVHAMAPAAKITILAMPSSDDDELSYAASYAVSHRSGQIVMISPTQNESIDGPSFASNMNAIMARAAAKGIAVDVSSSDDGDAYTQSAFGDPVIPSDSAFVTAVGGTSLGVPSLFGPVEAAWGTDLGVLGNTGTVNDPPQPFLPGFSDEPFVLLGSGSGGGQSAFISKPAWQASVTGAGRMVPDIAAAADYLTGLIAVEPDGSGEAVYADGGTEVANAIFSGIWALADQAAGTSLGQAAPILYRMKPGAITDIVPIPTGPAQTTTETITSGGTTAGFGPVDLVGPQPDQTGGFVAALTKYQATGGFLQIDPGDLYAWGFGTDGALVAAPGWDPATGLGVPNGLAFIRAAAAAAK